MPVRVPLNTAKSIFQRYHELQAERRERVRQAMDSYDRHIHEPALKALRGECATEGHSKGRTHTNGWGGVFCYCSKCGASIEP